MTVIYIVLFISPLLGAALGSFFAAQVMRGEKITKYSGPFSVDDTSGKPLKWFDLIPIFSFLFLRGKSRYTGKKLDLRMLLSEVLGFVTFFILAVGYFLQLVNYENNSVVFLINYLIIYFFLVALFYLAVYDMFTYSIPADATRIITIAAVGVNLLFGLVRIIWPEFGQNIGFGHLDNLLAGLVAGSFILLLIKLTKQKGMGEGDVYIALIIGILLGGQRGLAAFYITVITASLVGLIFMLRKHKLKGLIVPLVPFMALGFAGGAAVGNQLVNLLFFSI